MVWEAVGDEDVVAGEFTDRNAAESDERFVDAGAEDLEYVLDARLSVCGQAPKDGATGHHGSCAECECLDDVAAAADASVEEDLDVAANGVDDGRQQADRGRGAVEVVAAVVGDGDR